MQREHARSVRGPVWVLFACAVVLTSCGGGSGSNPPPNLGSAPGDAAITSFYQNAQSVTLTAHGANGNTATISVSLTPNSGTTTFNGATVDSDSETTTLKQNGTTVANSTQTVYFTVGPFRFAGFAPNTGFQYEVVQTNSPVPASVMVGQSGAFYTSTIYHDSTMMQIDATTSETYSVMALNPSALLVCIDTVLTAMSGNPDGLVSFTESDCYSVTAGGAVALVSVTVTENGTTLTFQ